MRSALIVIDMLNDFVDGSLGNPAAKEIIAPIAALVGPARGTDEWVVVYANDAHRASDVELRVFPPHAMAGTPGAAVTGELEPHAHDVVVPKRFYSAFTETELEQQLGSHGVGRLVLVGHGLLRAPHELRRIHTRLRARGLSRGDHGVRPGLLRTGPRSPGTGARVPPYLLRGAPRGARRRGVVDPGPLGAPPG